MRLAVALGLLVSLSACRVNSSGLAPDEATLNDSGTMIVEDSVARGEETLGSDAIVSDTTPVFPVDDSGSIPECTGKADGTACGAASPRSICVMGECIPSRCGDNVVDPGNGEDCDDGNIDDGDTCPGDCKARCKSDGECNDSNPCSIDSCDLTRRVCAKPAPVTKGTACTLPTGGAGVCNGTLCTAPSCGNRVVESGEDCDDGNTVDSDGCRSDCRWTCTRDLDCDDKNACTGAETCDLTKHTCKPGMTKTCADGNGCTTDKCNAPDGTCTNVTIDGDGDGYSPRGCGPMGTDCHDGNPRVYPGQMEWFTMPYTKLDGMPSFDYDCSGMAEKRFSTAGGCVKSGGSCTHNWGWVGMTPMCGGSDYVVEGCTGGSCKEIVSSAKVAQECH